jgi:amphi-Trp domain-containing protein
MSDEFEKEFVLDAETAAGFLRDMAEAIEEEEQVNMKFGEDEGLIQPVSGKLPLRIFQDDEGTEIGFRLSSD